MNRYSRLIDLIRAKFIKLGFTESQALQYTLDIIRESDKDIEAED